MISPKLNPAFIRPFGTTSDGWKRGNILWFSREEDFESSKMNDLALVYTTPSWCTANCVESTTTSIVKYCSQDVACAEFGIYLELIELENFHTIFSIRPSFFHELGHRHRNVLLQQLHD